MKNSSPKQQPKHQLNPRAPQTLLIGLLLVIATVIVFWQVRSLDFVNFDDDSYVTENLHVRLGLTWEGIRWAFTDRATGTWHPLTWLSLMLDSQFFGISSAAFHLTNLFFHIANTLLLFLVLFRMTGARLRSGFVAALFALHPLHVESVAWVVERKDVLSTFFWMLTMWAYAVYAEQTQGSRWKWYGLTLVFFALGLLAKPMPVTLPFVLLLLDYWPLHRIKKLSDGKRLILEKLPLIAIAGIASVLVFFTQQESGASKLTGMLTLWTRLANAMVSYAVYIVKMVWPQNLTILYPFSFEIPFWEIAASGLLLLCISFGVIRVSRKLPWLPVGWLWYLGTLVPVIGIVQIGNQAYADRYTYVPLIGLFIMIAWSIPSASPVRGLSLRFYKQILWVSTFALFAGFMILSSQQIQYWQNSITLFGHAIAVTDDNALAQSNIGVAYERLGKYDEAIGHFYEAVRIESGYPEAQNNLGVALTRQGKYQEAIEHFSKALEARPRYADAHSDLGVALARAGKLQEAIAQYDEALKLKPESAGAHNNLGLLYATLGKDPEALEQFSQAVKFDPEAADLHSNLGIILARQGKIQEAVIQYSESIRLDPRYVEAHNNLGVALELLGKHQDAIDQYSEALRINPNFPQSNNNLGLVRIKQGKTQEAIELYQKAVKNNPLYADAYFNLGHAYLLAGNRKAAQDQVEILKKLSPQAAVTLSKEMRK